MITNNHFDWNRCWDFALQILVFLLMLTLLTVWRFKIRKYFFLHETGVSMVMGLLIMIIMGVADDHY